jgi:DNA-binding Lrp family transcriptional regulator
VDAGIDADLAESIPFQPPHVTLVYTIGGSTKMKALTGATNAPVPVRRDSASSSEGVTEIKDAFLRNYHRLNITSGEAMVVVHISSIQQHEGEKALITAQMLADLMGITPAAVRYSIRSLEKKGFLAREQAHGGINCYDLAPLNKAIEKLSNGSGSAHRNGFTSATAITEKQFDAYIVDDDLGVDIKEFYPKSHNGKEHLIVFTNACASLNKDASLDALRKAIERYEIKHQIKMIKG